MSETFKACFERLEELSTEELDRSVVDLVRVENRNVALVIAHLAEIARRKGALERGYPSLFDYYLRRLGLSEGSVALRIQVANVSRRFPRVLAALAEGRISLSVAGRLAPHLREDNADTLLSDCAGMTTRAVEKYLVRLCPEPVFTPSIRKQPDAAPARGEAGTPVPAMPPLPLPAPSAPPGLLAPATPETYNFRFSAGLDFKAKLERLAEVLGIQNPAKNMAEVLERAVDLALERKDPQERLERRREREQRREAAAANGRDAEELRAREVAIENNSPRAVSRHVPAALRDKVLERAGHQCQYTGPDGTRCTARTGLEIEHERPFAIFRSHAEGFLSVLCARHNQMRAEQTYGAAHIRKKIEKRRLGRAGWATPPVVSPRSKKTGPTKPSVLWGPILVTPRRL